MTGFTENPLFLDPVNRWLKNANIADAVLDGSEFLSMEGSNAFELTVHDPRSNFVAAYLTETSAGDDDVIVLQPIDLKVGENYYRLSRVDANGDQITMTFEAREVVYLRSHDDKLVASRASVTRAQFIRRMVDEIAKPRRSVARPIAFWAPEVSVKQPVAKPTAEQTKQLAQDALSSPDTPIAEKARLLSGVTVKGKRATTEQKRNLLTALQIADDMKASTKVKIALIAALVTESTALNLPDGDGTSRGILQVTAATARNAGLDARDVSAVIKAFLNRGFYGNGGAIKVAKAHTAYKPHQIAQAVQGSGDATGGNYREWVDEATKTVKRISGDDAGGEGSYYYKQYQFLREQGENSWAAMNRLAEEVAKRVFVQDGIVIYASDLALIKLPARARLAVGDPTIQSYSYQLDGRKPVTEATLQVLSGEWRIPHGQPIVLEDSGPLDGKWLVWSVRKPISGVQHEVVLRKPQSPKAEPRSELAQTQGSGSSSGGIGGLDADSNIVKAYHAAEKIDRKHYKYVLGGGHAKAGTPTGGYDCSGAVAAVLVAAGWYSKGNTVPRSDALPSTAGAVQGKGKYMTIWANAGHVFLEFNLPGKGRQMWGTSRSNTNGGPGFTDVRSTTGFTAYRFPGD